jgi:GWxTD domain-containing protein
MEMLKFKKGTFVLIPFLMVMLLCLQCAEQRKIINNNFASQYQETSQSMQVETRLFHQGDSRTTLYFRLPQGMLSFKSLKEDKPLEARLLIRYKIYKSYESSKYLDSASIFINYGEDKEFQMIEGSIDVKTQRASKGVLDIVFIDLFQGAVFKTAIPFDRSNPDFPQHDYLLTSIQGDIIYQNIITAFKPVLLFFRNEKQRKLFMRYIPDEPTNLPATPFQEIVEKFSLPPALDSSIINNPDTIIPTLSGVLHIRSERWDETGLAILVQDAPYPEIGFTPQLVAPIRYLTSEKEFGLLSTASETKLALDEFWLKAGGNPAKARALLRTYYARVQMSNRLFSACRQGWQTDRGMVYVIFGPPDQVFRSDTDEVWYYLHQTFQSPLNFTFKKIKHAWCKDEFELERSTNYRNLWYAHIEAWRKGRIDTDKP